MNELYAAINLIQDRATREALVLIANNISKTKELRPVSENLTQIAYAVNKMTGNL